jgi:hypothetical protein
MKLQKFFDAVFAIVIILVFTVLGLPYLAIHSVVRWVRNKV